jgi:hypothetical protein
METPIKAMTRLTATALSAPTQIALQSTGHRDGVGRATCSEGSIAMFLTKQQ